MEDLAGRFVGRRRLVGRRHHHRLLRLLGCSLRLHFLRFLGSKSSFRPC